MMHREHAFVSFLIRFSARRLAVLAIFGGGSSSSDEISITSDWLGGGLAFPFERRWSASRSGNVVLWSVSSSSSTEIILSVVLDGPETGGLCRE